MNLTKKTEKVYGFIWTKDKDIVPEERWHFNIMQETIGEPIVRGKMGVEIGSGCGFDTYIIAKLHPSVSLVSVDLSDGIYKTKKLTSGLNNVETIKCSVLDMPLKNETFDFAYSFGVLHHTADPKRGLLEICRILKKGSPAFLYLYEDHSENRIKYFAIKFINIIRRITIRLSPKINFFLSWVFSPFVYIVFTLPAKILMKFKKTENIAKNMPFNFGSGFFSLRADIYDRFSAPIECRYNRKELNEMFLGCGFCEIKTAKFKDAAGWVAWGNKR